MSVVEIRFSTPAAATVDGMFLHAQRDLLNSREVQRICVIHDPHSHPMTYGLLVYC